MASNPSEVETNTYGVQLAAAVRKHLPSSQAWIFRRSHLVWGETVVSDTATSPKSIDRGGLGESHTGTRKERMHGILIWYTHLAATISVANLNT